MVINIVEAKNWPDKRYGGSAPGKLTITDLNAKFKRSRTKADDPECSGRSKSWLFRKI